MHMQQLARWQAAEKKYLTQWCDCIFLAVSAIGICVVAHPSSSPPGVRFLHASNTHLEMADVIGLFVEDSNGSNITGFFNNNATKELNV